MRRAFIFLADGFEITEGMATIDMLVRGEADVRIISVTGDNVVDSAQGIPVIAQYLLKEIPVADTVFSGDEFLSLDEIGKDDIMIFPGGMPGTKNLAVCAPLMEKMKKHYAAGGYVAAICAAPGFVLSQLPLEERTCKGPLMMTGYEGCNADLEKKGVTIVDQRTGVVQDGNIISASGPGHAVAFGLKILEVMRGKETAESVRKALML